MSLDNFKKKAMQEHDVALSGLMDLQDDFYKINSLNNRYTGLLTCVMHFLDTLSSSCYGYYVKIRVCNGHIELYLGSNIFTGPTLMNCIDDAYDHICRNKPRTELTGYSVQI